ncbi:hypothetical protein BBJ28_00011195 [Nothophytophthora sp. Chile5]|nr:hypothetical protein BBJ28_00011195 [Nothophytophthora sp. Chile5]
MRRVRASTREKPQQQHPHVMKRLLLSLGRLPRPLRSRALVRCNHDVAVSSPNRFPEPVVPKSKRDRQFLAALQVFYRLEGHFTVPLDFVIPSPLPQNSPDSADAGDINDVVAPEDFPWPRESWGLDLGVQLRLFTRGRCSPFKCALLRTIGFPYDDWKTYVWEAQVIPALHVFKKLYGYLFVRQKFMVPVGDDRWPRAAWGVNLGLHCQIMRRDVKDGLFPERKKQLDAIGFIWSSDEWKWKVQFLSGIGRFRELFGHCNVPHHFTVPKNDAMWPEVVWEYRLGVFASQARTNSEQHILKPRAVADLRDVDFYEQDLALNIWREAVLPCLELYPRRNAGGTDIPVGFVVPSEAPWPERAWGMHLGYIVATINNNLLFQEEMQGDKARLKELGYTWDLLFGKWTKQFIPALRHYKAEYQHCDVPTWWKVPSSDASWPKALRGYKLGDQVVRMRRGGRDHADVADVLMDLDALGFKFNAFEGTFVDRVLPALEVYTEIYGNCHVPPNFVVPAESTWPRPSWGTKLGHAMRNIRSRQQHVQQAETYHERLEQLGFEWQIYKSAKSIMLHVVQPSLEVFREIHGEDADVPHRFVVPADDPRWPEVARNFELGAWLRRHNRHTTGFLSGQTTEGKKRLQPVSRANDGQETLSEHAEEYWKDVLLAAFQAYASVHGSCEHMASGFIVPDEAPFPQSAWGLNLGLRLRHLRRGARYAKEIAKYRNELEAVGIVPVVNGAGDQSGGQEDDEDEGEERDGDDTDEVRGKAQLE